MWRTRGARRGSPVLGYGPCVHGPYPDSPAKPVTVATPDPAGLPDRARRGSLDPAGLPDRARRGSLDPAGLHDRQVSRTHRWPSFQRCSCLLSLLQIKETFRSSIWAGSGDPRPARVRAWGGVRRPAPSAGSYLGRGQETRAQREFVLGAGSGDPRPARVRAWGGVRRPSPSAGSCLGRGLENRAERGRV